MAHEDLGGGVLLFRDSIKINKSILVPYLMKLRENVVSEDFTVIHDENGTPLHAINRSGHRYEVERINHVNRINKLIESDVAGTYKKFFQDCEKSIYNSLLEYIEKYPMILPSLWWKEQGHVVSYSPGSAMGFHSDNDVNYQPGAIPDLQLATRHVVGCILYLNDSIEGDEFDENSYDFVGGELNFAYLGICHKPKAGDLLIFPSNYLATHEVLEIKSGFRFAYISYFSHGSEDLNRGISPAQKLDSLMSGQVWIPEIFDDYKKYLKNKYKESYDSQTHCTLPLGRVNKSNGTIEEKDNEQQKRNI